MSKKTLRMNRFGESIMGEYDLFYYRIRDIHRKYSDDLKDKEDIFQVKFDWVWNGYEGYGLIDYFKSAKVLCNIFGENESNMTIDSKSKRKQPNGRHTCSLYNDPSLASLFELMLSKINLDNTLTNKEWLEKVTQRYETEHYGKR